MFQRLFFLLALSTFTCTLSMGQGTLALHVTGVPNNASVDQLKTYIGDFEWSYADKTVTLPEYRLIDWIQQPQFQLEGLSLEGLRSFSFLVGVDSTQLLQGAMEGDLDPGKGMFWAWQSGYIHLKLEYVEAGAQKTYHVGGYKGKQNTVFRLTFDIPEDEELRGIQFNMHAFMSRVQSENIGSVMSPGEKAVTIARYYPDFIKPLLNEAQP